MGDRRDEYGRRVDEYGNPIQQQGAGGYYGYNEDTTGYRAGPEGYGPYGTTGYEGVRTGGMHNPSEESGGRQQQTRPGATTGQTGHGYGQGRQEGGRRKD